MSKVTITKEEYDHLQFSQKKLWALEAGGVDNWEFYHESLKEVIREQEREKAWDECITDILTECSEHVEFPIGREGGGNITEEARAGVKVIILKTLKLIETL